VSVTWNGEELKKKKDKAVEWAMKVIMADCVRDAKVQPPMPVKTATLQGSIQMRNPEKIDGKWVGLWGSWNVLYAVFQEIGTIFMKGKFFLRRAADKNYPRFAGKIKEGMAALSK
jgi:HK97 gp10 family phage protein